MLEKKIVGLSAWFNAPLVILKTIFRANLSTSTKH